MTYVTIVDLDLFARLYNLIRVVCCLQKKKKKKKKKKNNKKQTNKLK